MGQNNKAKGEDVNKIVKGKVSSNYKCETRLQKININNQSISIYGSLGLQIILTI